MIGQPDGQVPFTAVVHCGSRDTPFGASQHSAPGMQHWMPQQNSFAGQRTLQGGSMHAPPWQ